MAAGIVAVVFALEVAAVCLTAGEQGLAEAVLYLVYAVTQAAAGALIVHRFPRHPIGWLFLLYALGTPPWPTSRRPTGSAPRTRDGRSRPSPSSSA